MGFSVDPEVEAAVRARAKSERAPISHIIEDILRVALGLPPVPDAVAFEPGPSATA